jgi:hypothetical protein
MILVMSLPTTDEIKLSLALVSQQPTCFSAVSVKFSFVSGADFQALASLKME